MEREEGGESGGKRGGRRRRKEINGKKRKMDGWNGWGRLDWKRFKLTLRFKKPEQGGGTFDQFT